MDGDTGVFSQDSRWLLGSYDRIVSPSGLVPGSNIIVKAPLSSYLWYSENLLSRLYQPDTENPLRREHTGARFLLAGIDVSSSYVVFSQYIPCGIVPFVVL